MPHHGIAVTTLLCGWHATDKQDIYISHDVSWVYVRGDSSGNSCDERLISARQLQAMFEPLVSAALPWDLVWRLKKINPQLLERARAAVYFRLINRRLTGLQIHY